MSKHTALWDRLEVIMTERGLGVNRGSLGGAPWAVYRSHVIKFRTAAENLLVCTAHQQFGLGRGFPMTRIRLDDPAIVDKVGAAIDNGIERIGQFPGGKV